RAVGAAAIYALYIPLLHRLRAHRASAATARRAQAWAEQALAWMLEADIVDRVDATATVAGGRLDLDITLYRGGAAVLRSAWANLT
ncbi:MAG TPA: phage GP46 family protein, partial [Myxococcota bacterium]|nr:phage GP46 family protein [Myxococcota bacterium]